MQCESQGLEVIIKSLSGCNFYKICLENGYIFNKNKNYTNGEKCCSLSFKEFYLSKNKSLKEQSKLKEKMDNHIKKFEELISDSIYIISTPIDKFQEFKKYLSTQ